MNTQNADGYVVQTDKETRIHLDIPLTNQQDLAAAKANLQRGFEKITEHFHPTHSVLDSSSSQLEKSNLDKKPAETKESEAISDTESTGNEVDKPNLPNAKDEEKNSEKNEGSVEIPSETKEHLNELVAQAEDEVKTTGQLSPETEQQLRKKMEQVLISMAKEGVGEGLDKLGELIEDGTVGLKIYVGAKGLLVRYVLNTAAAYQETPNTLDSFVHGLTSTVADKLVGSGLVIFFGAIPAYWIAKGLFVTTLWDKLTYDKAAYEQHIDELINYAHQAKQTGNFQEGFFAVEAMRVEREWLANQNLTHNFAQIYEGLDTFFKWGYGLLKDHFVSPKIEEQKSIKQTDALQQHGFFEPSSGVVSSEPEAEKMESKNRYENVK